MALSFPRDFPTCARFERVTFKPQYQQATSVTGGGSPNVAELGPPMWAGEWSVRTLNREQYAEWSAWLRSLRGGLRTFKGRPPHWKWPRAYPTGFDGLLVGGLQWDGSGAIAAISAGKDTVTVDGVPNGLVLNAGDWLSATIGTRQVLHQITEGGTADGSGVVTVTVEPTIRPTAAVDDVVLLEAPYCDMVLIDAPDMDLTASKLGSFSFAGLQVLI